MASNARRYGSDCGTTPPTLRLGSTQIREIHTRSKTRRHLLPAGLGLNYWIVLFEAPWPRSISGRLHFQWATIFSSRCDQLLHSGNLTPMELLLLDQPGNAGQGLCFAIVQWHRLPLSWFGDLSSPKRFSVLPLSGNIISHRCPFVNLFFTEIQTF